MFSKTLKIFSAIAVVLAVSTSGFPLSMPPSSTGTGGSVTPDIVSIDPVRTETVPNLDYLKDLVKAYDNKEQAFFAAPLPAGENVIMTDSHTTFETKIDGTVAKHIVKRTTTSVPTGTGMTPSVTIDILSIDTDKNMDGAHCTGNENSCRRDPKVKLDFTGDKDQTVTYFIRQTSDADKIELIKSTCQEAICEREISTHKASEQENIMMTLPSKPEPESQDPLVLAANQDPSSSIIGGAASQDGSVDEGQSVPAAAKAMVANPLMQASAAPGADETSSQTVDESQPSCVGDQCKDTTGNTTPPGEAAEGSPEEEASETPEQEAAEKSEGSPEEEASETPGQEAAETQGADSTGAEGSPNEEAGESAEKEAAEPQGADAAGAEGSPEEEASETPEQEASEPQGAESAGAEGTPEEEASETPDQEAAESQESQQ